MPARTLQAGGSIVSNDNDNEWTGLRSINTLPDTAMLMSVEVLASAMIGQLFDPLTDGRTENDLDTAERTLRQLTRDQKALLYHSLDRSALIAFGLLALTSQFSGVQPRDFRVFLSVRV